MAAGALPTMFVYVPQSSLAQSRRVILTSGVPLSFQGSKGTFSIRSKVNSTLGRGSSSDSGSHRDPTPISSLRDPSSFAPPPKRIDSAIRPPPGRSGSSQQQQQQPLALTQYGHQEEDEQEPAPPPRPYRVDTTGLSTANLPPTSSTNRRRLVPVALLRNRANTTGPTPTAGLHPLHGRRRSSSKAAAAESATSTPATAEQRFADDA